MIKSIDKCIEDRDEEGLRVILASGWRAPAHPFKFAGRVESHQIWLSILLLDWPAGFRILDEYFPEVSDRIEWWDTAMTAALPNMSAFLWDRLRIQDILAANPEIKNLWLERLMIKMGAPWISTPATDIRPMLDFFKSKGVDLTGPLSGDFEPNDLRASGHTLRTRAVSVGCWSVVDYFQSDRRMDPSPRLPEVILIIIRKITGDCVFFGRPLAASPDEINFLNREMAVNPEIFAASPSFWSEPGHSLIAPIFRLPAASVFSSLPNYWNMVSSVLPSDSDATWLHVLAMHPTDPDTVFFMKALMASPAAASARRAWVSQGSLGFSAADRWRLNDGPNL